MILVTVSGALLRLADQTASGSGRPTDPQRRRFIAIRSPFDYGDRVSKDKYRKPGGRVGLESLLEMLAALEDQPWIKGKELTGLREFVLRNLVDSARTTHWDVRERDGLIRAIEHALLSALKTGGWTEELAIALQSPKHLLKTMHEAPGQTDLDRSWDYYAPLVAAASTGALTAAGAGGGDDDEGYSSFELPATFGGEPGRPEGGRARSEERFVLCRCYVSGVAPGSDEANAIWRALADLAGAAGFKLVWRGEEQPGSVWRDWLFRGGKKAAKNLASGAAVAVTDSYVRAPGAEATGELAQAAATLLNALGEREGAFVFDNLLIAQFRGNDGEVKSLAMELNLEQRRAIHRDPSLLTQPATLMAGLMGHQSPALPGGGSGLESSH